MKTQEIISIKNINKLELEVSTLGATIVSLKIPDGNNNLTNVVVGLSEAKDYMSNPYLSTGLYLGATVGRYAGRISRGQFSINSEVFPIYNEDSVHLHGGKEGFDKKIWEVESIVHGNSSSVTLSYFSKHTEEGYPGNLNVSVKYTLTENNALQIEYKAITDKTTIINLTNHSYFNLNGKGSILDHELLINSDFYLDVDKNLIPTGKFNSVKNTQFDYNMKSLIRKNGFQGMDDTFILKENKKEALLLSRTSGIRMKVTTNQPAVVIYTPLEFQKLPFKDNATYFKFPAICFETQHYPDSPNNAHFPSTILKPNQTYLNKTKFEFSII